MTAAARLDETRRDDTPIPRFDLVPWAERWGIVAGLTDARSRFDLGLASPAPTARVIGHWKRLFAAFRPGFETFVISFQPHGTAIALHGGGQPGWTVCEGFDGHLTRSAGVLLLVSVADCVPVYLLHPGTRTVGLLHAGWRGTAAGILERGIERLAEVTKANVSELLIHCGISICGRCYEVGSDVVEALTGTAPNGKAHVDLRAELARRAEALGVGGVTLSGWCTAHDDAWFYSHRRSGGQDGRMVAFAGVARLTP